MPFAVGLDAVSVSRVERALRRRAGLAERLFTKTELSECAGKRDRTESLAARFAAKEAVLKALGRGLSGCSWHDIEVTGTPPAARLAGPLTDEGVLSVSLSITHEAGLAVAVCLLERE